MRVFPHLTVDGEFETLGTLGYTGTLNDRQFAYLSSLGLTGTLSDMFSNSHVYINDVFEIGVFL